MDPSLPSTFTINGIVADLASEMLLDRQGNALPLRPQSFLVLRYLLQNRGRLVTKDELIKAVWAGTAVTDDSLVQCVHEIRRALKDDAHAVLATVSRRGYRLVLPEPVTAPARDLPSPRNRLRVAIIVAPLLIVTAGAAAWWVERGSPPSKTPVVAVLPFNVLAEDASSARLAKGLTEDIVTDLARFPEFEVIAFNSTEPYAGKTISAIEVGSALGASFVVTGTIQRQTERVRVTAQLVEAASGRNLWTDRWDRPAQEIFAIQTEIAERISNRLGGGAGLVQEAGRIAAHRKAPRSLNAYELYLLGTERLEKVDRANLEAALELLNQAVESDPELARGWIELYHTHHLLAGLGIETERNRALGHAAAERALSLDPSDAEAHAVYGSSLGMRGDFVRAEAAYETALRMAPNAAEILIFYTGWASSFGKPERGADLVERAIRLDPNYPAWANRPFAMAYFMAGRYDDAVAMFERLGVARHNLWSWSAHAGALAALGRQNDAAVLVAKAIAAHPDLSIELIANEPGWTDAEHQRFIDTMRLAGFPACAKPEMLSTVQKPLRLPECASSSTNNQG